MTSKADQKDRTHSTILQSAARLLLQKGISGARVLDVMKGAGLTVGGFYAHFTSKEALVDDALLKTATQMRAQLFAKLDEKPAASRAEVVLKRYLSAAHRDAGAIGCPLPAVVGEVATTAPEHAPALAVQVEQFADELAGHLPSDAPLSKRQIALAFVSLMFGGLTLARALRGTALSDDVLRACRALGRLALPAVPGATEKRS